MLVLTETNRGYCARKTHVFVSFIS